MAFVEESWAKPNSHDLFDTSAARMVHRPVHPTRCKGSSNFSGFGNHILPGANGQMDVGIQSWEELADLRFGTGANLLNQVALGLPQRVILIPFDNNHP